MAQVSKRRKLSDGGYELSSTSQPTVNEVISPAITSDAAAEKVEQRRSLFVRSLPASVTSESLTQHFSQLFPLKHATVVLDPKTKTSRGFGFVTFVDAEDALAAVEQLNNSILDGRKIKVEIAESRHREIEEDITGVRKETKNIKAEELRAQRQKKIDENRPPKLIVRNLPWSVKTSEDLAKLFMSYGKVKHATLPQGKGGQLAGFGFVILRGKRNAERALEGVNGKEIDGRTLAVDWAVDKEAWEKSQENEKVKTIEEVEDVNNDSEDKNAKSAHEAPKDDSVESEPPSDSDSDSDSEAGAEVAEAEETDEEEAIMNGAVPQDDEATSTDSQSNDLSKKQDTNSTTIFIRNLAFTADDEVLKNHFQENFGAVRYARVVYDHETERSRGTAFVCFFNETDAKDCVKNAPKQETPSQQKGNDKKKKGDPIKHSLLQNDFADPSGRYTMDGRVLQVTRALSKDDADRRMKEASVKRDHDKRRLYLLSEGTIPNGSKLYSLLGKAEIDIRESSARQRQRLVKTNPNLGLSLTRLSIRNVPRSVTSKDLKALAREAVVEFAKDVKAGKRQPLSKEEVTRGGDVDRQGERERKAKGKGIVKQVKIVFESEKTGSKVGEGKGGRSRGYGFIEYYGHRNALMGLRWLNGHLVKAAVADAQGGKRLIVEFAIENAQVVQRRQDREKRAKEGDWGRKERYEKTNLSPGKKRKREDSKPETGKNQSKKKKKNGNDGNDAKAALSESERNKLAMRNRIIAEKRQKRKMRKGKS